jgi:hypothetical protein
MGGLHVSEYHYVPEHIISAFRGTLAESLPPETRIYDRSLRATDSAMSVGLRLGNYIYDSQSAVIGQQEPALGSYSLTVQNMVKHTDEEIGRKVHYIQCALVRAVLYRSNSLRLRLLGADEELMGSTERVKRFGVKRQDFLSNQVSGSFMYLCATEMYVETENTLL